jgi:hypothetical protein
MSQDDENLYGSGLNRVDWYELAGQIVPHYAFRDGRLVSPREVDPAPLPLHLSEHPVAKLVNQYRMTGDNDLLDQAGQLLVPGNEHWWLIITKS